MRRPTIDSVHSRRAALLAMALSLTAGCASMVGPSRPVTCSVPDSAAQRSVVVTIPEVYELANIILALTNYQTLASHTVFASPYLTEVRNHFTGVSAHPLVAALNTRLTGSGTWDYDVYFGFRENSFAYGFGPSGLERNSSYARVWGGTDAFGQEIARVEDFANQGRFREFFASHADFYADQVQRYRDLVLIDRMWHWLETRFPDRYDRYTIVFSPLIYGSHSTQRFTTGGLRETIMFIAGPDIVQNTADERLRTAELERLVFTEIDHNYVNPGTDRHQQRVKDVFRNVGFWNADVNYRSAVATFNEYMTWAVFNVYARDTYDSATAAAFRESVIRSMVQQRKFLKFREFEQIVMEVSAASGPQPCIPNLYGEILDRAAAIR